MQVQRLGDQTSGFTMHYWMAKEKKPKATVIRYFVRSVQSVAPREKSEREKSLRRKILSLKIWLRVVFSMQLSVKS